MQLLCPQCSFPLAETSITDLTDGELYQCPECGLESELHIDSAAGEVVEPVILLEPLAMKPQE